MAAFNPKSFLRKLQNMSSAQDSVQTLSLWIIHHKRSANDIVKVWIDQLKKCNTDRRLILFYLANDVLQNSRKKGKEFSSAFARVLREAVPLLSDKSIKDAVKRVLQIWQDRKVFEVEFIDDLRGKLDKSNSSNHSQPSKSVRKKEKEKEKPNLKEVEKPASKPSKPEKRLPPADFKPSKLIDALDAMRKFESEVTLQESQLNSLRIDASDMEAIKQLKDRSTGARFTEEYEMASQKLEKFCKTIEQEKEERSQLISVVEDGGLFYDAAYGEVKVIVHAYKTFGNRLNSLKKKLDHKVDKLIQAENEKKKMGPITTPQASFLSSGLPEMSTDTPSTTPPQDTGEAKQGKPSDQTVDNTEVADMDLDEDSDSENGKSSESSSTGQKTTPSAQDSPITAMTTATTVTASKSAVSISETSSSSVSNTTKSAATTTDIASTSAVPIVIPAQVQGQAPMILQRPTMSFIPNQSGMPMMTMGLPGQGAYLPLGQFGQPMVPYGMVPGMTSMPLIPTQLQRMQPGIMPTVMPHQLPSQANSVGLSSTNQDATSSSKGNPSQAATSGSLSTMSTVTSPGTAPLAQQVATTASASTTTTKSLSAPRMSTTKLPSVECASPSSELSAPSPTGSPELALGGDETPETASPREALDMKIIEFPSATSYMQKAGESDPQSPSGGTGSVPQSSDMSKTVSASDILAKLLNRGKSDQGDASGTSTPIEEPHPPQENTGRPLKNLIDSLFPKLATSLNMIKTKENEASTSTSEEGSPEAKIELNPEDDDDSEADRPKEDHLNPHFHSPGFRHMGLEGVRPQWHNGSHSARLGDPRPEWQGREPPSLGLAGPRHQFPGPQGFNTPPKGILKPLRHPGLPGMPQSVPYQERELMSPIEFPPNSREGHSPRGLPPEEFHSEQRRPSFGSDHSGPSTGRQPSDGQISPYMNRGPSFANRPPGPEGYRRPSHEGASREERPPGIPYPDNPRLGERPPIDVRRQEPGREYYDQKPGPPGRPPFEPDRLQHEARIPPHDQGRPPYEPGRPPHEPGRPPHEPGRPPHEPGRPPHEPGRPPHEPGRPPHEPGRPPHEPGRPPYEPGRPPHEPGRPPHELGRPPHEPGRPPHEPGRLPHEPGRPPYEQRRPPHEKSWQAFEHQRISHEHGGPLFEPGRPPHEPGRPSFDQRRPPYDQGRPGMPPGPRHDQSRPPLDEGRPPLDPGRPGPGRGRGYPPGDRSPRGVPISPGFDRREEFWRERPGPPENRPYHDNGPNTWTENERFRNPEWERHSNTGIRPQLGPEGNFPSKRPGPPFQHAGPPKRPYF
ncbi:predicted protein [Nematostella vectensis]|uniref:CID domain-containing protein n=1 Tax=Nematostella vectensis TaxID=45351 RepID=A7SYN2_NEMVE|nr:predicted protein [Nematostella vectensis]|eukprot:XP_001623291.1 predicted protein [Nematostella vectensis]